MSTGRTETEEARACVARLERRLGEVLAEIERSEVFAVVTNPETDPRLLATIMKYVLLESFTTGPHVTEATFMAISRLPKSRPDLMKPMILHDLSEVDHGEMALRDFVQLGGDEAWARSRRMSPAEFAMCATVRMIGERESPFAYLGYMYLLEGLTPIVTARLQQILQAKGFPVRARTFIDLHAVEDIGHANEIRDLILRVVSEYPEAASAIEYAFDCFEAVFPLPVWRGSLKHARAEVARG